MYVLGLYSDGNYFKVSFISIKKGKVQIEFLKEFNKNISNLDALKKSIEKKSSFLNGDVDIVTALPMHEVFVKKLVIPLTKEKDVYKALELQLSLDDTYLEEDRLFIPKFCRKGKETEVTLYGVTKDLMEKHLLAVEELGINPDCVSTISSAFSRFTEFCNFPKDPYFLFHLGWEISSVHFFCDGEIIEESSFNMGFKDIIDAAQKDHLLVDGVDMDKVQELFVEAIDDGKESAARQCFSRFKNQVARIYRFIEEKDARAKSPCKTVFTGYAEFSRAVKVHIEELDRKELIPEHEVYTAAQISSYAIEIGLALDNEGMNLATGPFLTKGLKNKAMKHMKKYAIASFCCLAAIFLSVGTFFGRKEALLAKDYDRVVSKIEEFTGGKVLSFSDSKGDLIGNRKRVSKLIKSRKQKDEMDRKPVPFSAISNLFGKILPKSFLFDEIDYQKDGDSVVLSCYFEGEDKELRAEAFKGKMIVDDDEYSLAVEEEVVKGGDRCLVKVRVKG